MAFFWGGGVNYIDNNVLYTISKSFFRAVRKTAKTDY